MEKIEFGTRTVYGLQGRRSIVVYEKNLQIEDLMLDIDNTILGDLMTIEEFIENVLDGTFTNNDGSGYLATSTKGSNIEVSPTALMYGTFYVPEWATHVIWYNK